MNADSVVAAIKAGRVSVVTRPLRSWESLWVYLRLWWGRERGDEQ
jgi:hypothetical protein